jgi:flagellar biosynthesis/type III secretory pathway protein FliH
VNGIIKSANSSGLSAVHALADPPSVAPIIPLGKHDEERDALLRRIARMEEELRQHEAEAQDLRVAAVTAREQGVEQGYESGLIAAEDRQAERLSLLENAMMRAQANLAESLTSLSRLSALLAQDCVDIILGDAGDRAGFIERIIDVQVARIDRAMLAAIHLSRMDFPDDADLAALTARFGSAAIAVTAGADLPSGACVMTLRLGRLSVGIDQQWPVLKTLLDEMALPEAAQ